MHVNVTPAIEHAPIQVHESGAKREAAKLPYHLIPVKWWRWLAAIFAEGLAKYGEDNWTKGLPPAEVEDHMLEHYLRWKEGDTSEDHLGKIAWNALALKWTEEQYGYHHIAQHDTKPDSNANQGVDSDKLPQ